MYSPANRLLSFQIMLEAFSTILNNTKSPKTPNKIIKEAKVTFAKMYIFIKDAESLVVSSYR